MKAYLTKTFLIVMGLCAALSLSAQTTENFVRKYNSLVSRVGYTGVGVEYLLDSWERADSTDINYMLARFNYYMEKSQRDTVIVSRASRYIGMQPVMSLKDSSGRQVNYFNEVLYDERYYNRAMHMLDRAIVKNNARLDLYCTKAETMIAHDKYSAEASSAFILKMIERHYKARTKWEHPGMSAAPDNKTFEDIILSYCFDYYRIGGNSCMEAFNNVSTAMLKNKASDSAFTDNVGTYLFLVKKDYKKAAKMYSAALKKNPEDEVAKKNLELVKSRLSGKKR